MRYRVSYLAGVIEARGKITYKPLSVTLRMQGSIPKYLHRKFGGTCFLHMPVKKRRKKGDPKFRVFRVHGKAAHALLLALKGHWVGERRRVKQYLKKAEK